MNIDKETSSAVKAENEDAAVQPSTSVRQRTLTEKGREARLAFLKSRQIASLSAVTRKSNEIKQLLLNEDNLHLVKSSFEAYKELCRSYEECFLSYFEETVDPETQDKLQRRYYDHESTIMDFKSHVITWVHQTESKLSDQLSDSGTKSHAKSTSSRSQRSCSKSGSGRSTTSSQSSRTRHKAKLAELLADKATLAQQQKVRELQLSIAIAKAEAREMVYEEEERKHTSPDPATTSRLALQQLATQPSATPRDMKVCNVDQSSLVLHKNDEIVAAPIATPPVEALRDHELSLSSRDGVAA